MSEKRYDFNKYLEQIADEELDVGMVNIDPYNQGPYPHLFLIRVPDGVYVVSAQDEQHALDITVDYWEETHYYHYLKEELTAEFYGESLDGYIQGGSNNRYLAFTSDELQIEQIK